MRQERSSVRAALLAVWLSIVGGLMLLATVQLEAVAYPFSNLATGSGDYLAEMVKSGTFRWTAGRMPLHVYIDDGAGVSAYRPQFKQIMRDAFNAWMQAAGGKLSWVEVSDPRRADIVTTWSDSISVRNGQLEAGRTTAVTQTDRYSGERSLVAAEVRILTRIGPKVFSDSEIRKTTLHEVGHALGLQGHSPVSSDIMYPSLSLNQVPYLQDRDASTISHLYAGYPIAPTASGASQMALSPPSGIQDQVPQTAMLPRARGNAPGANAPFAQLSTGNEQSNAPFAEGYHSRWSGGGYRGGYGCGGYGCGGYSGRLRAIAEEIARRMYNARDVGY